MQQKDVFPRIPAKYLADVELHSEAFEPDFELTDKYQSFTSELLRLSLLGIAGYGFLVSEVIMKDKSALLIKAMEDWTWLFGIGVIFLGISTATALAHRFFTTECLGMQVAILRHLKRKENVEKKDGEEKKGWWPEAYLEEDARRIALVRERQKKALLNCKCLLLASVISLTLGAVAVVVIFSITFFTYSNLPTSPSG